MKRSTFPSFLHNIFMSVAGHDTQRVRNGCRCLLDIVLTDGKTKLPPHAQLGMETMETSWTTVDTPVIECCLLLGRMIWCVFGKHCFRKRKMDCVCSRIHNILHPESTHKTRDFSARRRSLCQKSLSTVNFDDNSNHIRHEFEHADTQHIIARKT